MIDSARMSARASVRVWVWVWVSAWESERVKPSTRQPRPENSNQAMQAVPDKW